MFLGKERQNSNLNLNLKNTLEFDGISDIIMSIPLQGNILNAVI